MQSINAVKIVHTSDVSISKIEELTKTVDTLKEQMRSIIFENLALTAEKEDNEAIIKLAQARINTYLSLLRNYYRVICECAKTFDISENPLLDKTHSEVEALLVKIVTEDNRIQYAENEKEPING